MQLLEVAHLYRMMRYKPKHLIEMGATLPDNASYEPLLLQLKSMLQETDYEKWFGYGRAGESLWQKHYRMLKVKPVIYL